MKLYLGGKMIGIPGLGFPMFDEAAEQIRSMGFEVFNPAERDRSVGFTGEGLEGTYAELLVQRFDRREALGADMAWIAEHSDGMVALSNWVDSPGAKAEITLHHGLYLPVWEYDYFVKLGTDAPEILPLEPAMRRLPHSPTRLTISS